MHTLSSLIYVQIGQFVQNSALEHLLMHCPNLRHLHCNTCPDLTDHELNILVMRSVCVKLKYVFSLSIFYICDQSFYQFSDASTSMKPQGYHLSRSRPCWTHFQTWFDSATWPDGQWPARTFRMWSEPLGATTTTFKSSAALIGSFPNVPNQWRPPLSSRVMYKWVFRIAILLTRQDELTNICLYL